MTRATASKAGLLAECGWWARPEAEWATSTSAAAERGTAFHEAIADYVDTGVLLEAYPEEIAALMPAAAAWVDSFGRTALQAEVAFAWHPVDDDAVRRLSRHRDYRADQARGYLCGTVDLVAISRATNVGYVADWKTGDASTAGPQLRALALMLARAEGLECVTVEALEVTAEGVTTRCTETLDAFALDAVAGEIAEALAAVSTAEPNPGRHCAEMYCPARATCPAVVERIDDIIPAAALVRGHRWGLTIASPDHAAWLYEQAKAVEAAAKDVREAVRAYLPEGGLVLSDGSTMREGTRTMTRRDHVRMEALARSLGATDEQVVACDRAVVESSGVRVTRPRVAKRPDERRAVRA